MKEKELKETVQKLFDFCKKHDKCDGCILVTFNQYGDAECVLELLGYCDSDYAQNKLNNIFKGVE